MKIKNATAIYTGGNIYIYYGKLLDGTYFRACDDWDWIEICDSDTSVDEADYQEFYEEHGIKTLVTEEYELFWNEMLLWIMHNVPTGNYSIDELESRIIEYRPSTSNSRTIKITAGMTGEFEIIGTNASDSLIKAQLTYNSDLQENRKEIDNPYAIIEAMGYWVSVIGDQDGLSEEDLEDGIIDAEFDYYDF